MAFQIAESQTGGIIDSGTIATLSPGPTYVEYPTKFDNTIRFSKDGNPTIQAPLKDARVRHWVWRRYRPTVPGYENLFSQLLQLQYKLRLTEDTPKPPWVFLKEDVSENFSPLQFSGGTWSVLDDFVRVKVVDVTQNVARQGGIVIYEETRLSFVVDDSNWNTF
jgi:hypothetical protein